MLDNNEKKYDCAIIGGGLAGLCLAIQLAQKGFSVVLFEKNTYPFNKVCGEYISNESRDFLERLGLPLSQMNLPVINQLGISSVKGFMMQAPLKMGGFGISRYRLDHQLSLIAKKAGVEIIENCKVFNVKENNDGSEINVSAGKYNAKIVCGSYGKLSPAFIDKTKKTMKQYIGVKYHIKTKFADNRIELHNFKNGYCGISKVDNETYCLCYLTTAKSLRNNNNDIKQLEENILMQNPFLKKYFTESEFVFKEPLTISSISFNKKTTYSNGIFLLGDASGAIAPLCGNGMSMGMRASFILAKHMERYFKKEITKNGLISSYKKEWDQNFSVRIKAGYYLQQIFGKNIPTHLSLKFLNSFSGLTGKIISLTHGQPF
jgi:flavin-dependent dehydrogenase